MIVPPVADHVTAVLVAPVTVAVNCCVPFASKVSGFGVTVMVASAPMTTVTYAVPEIAPLAALTVLV